MTDIQRIDYSKPPPGYTVRFEDSSGANGDGPPLWWYGAPHYLASMGSEAEALSAAWANHKAHNDPPGMWIERVRPPEYAPRGTTSVWWTYYAGGGGLLCLFAKPDEVVARAAAWAWYDRRLALWEKLHNGAWCPECHSDDAYCEAIDDTRCTQPWCTECDVEMGALFDDQWPAILTWSDDQVAAVERWLVDSTAEMPEVLRG